MDDVQREIKRQQLEAMINDPNKVVSRKRREATFEKPTFVEYSSLGLASDLMTDGSQRVSVDWLDRRDQETVQQELADAMANELDGMSRDNPDIDRLRSTLQDVNSETEFNELDYLVRNDTEGLFVTQGAILEGKIAAADEGSGGSMAAAFGWIKHQAINNNWEDVPKGIKSSFDWFNTDEKKELTPEHLGVKMNDVRPSDADLERAGSLMGKTTNSNSSTFDPMGDIRGNYYNNADESSDEQLRKEFTVDGMSVDHASFMLAQSYIDSGEYVSKSDLIEDTMKIAKRLQIHLPERLREVAVAGANKAGSTSYLDALPTPKEVKGFFANSKAPPMLRSNVSYGEPSTAEEYKKLVGKRLKAMARVYNIGGDNRAAYGEKTGLSATHSVGNYYGADVLNEIYLSGQDDNEHIVASLAEDVGALKTVRQSDDEFENANIENGVSLGELDAEMAATAIAKINDGNYAKQVPDWSVGDGLVLSGEDLVEHQKKIVEHTDHIKHLENIATPAAKENEFDFGIKSLDDIGYTPVGTQTKITEQMEQEGAMSSTPVQEAVRERNQYSATAKTTRELNAAFGMTRKSHMKNVAAEQIITPLQEPTIGASNIGGGQAVKEPIVPPVTNEDIIGQHILGAYGESHLDTFMSKNAQGTDGWHNDRNGTLTATIADAIIKNSDKNGRISGFIDSAVGRSSGIIGGVNPAFVRGHEHEEAFKKWLPDYVKNNQDSPEAKLLKQLGVDKGVIADVGMITNANMPGLGASLDGLLSDKIGFEHKSKEHFLDITTPKFKDHEYYHQMQMQMMVAGTEGTMFGQTYKDWETGKWEKSLGYVAADKDWRASNGEKIQAVGGLVAPLKKQLDAGEITQNQYDESVRAIVSASTAVDKNLQKAGNKADASYGKLLTKQVKKDNSFFAKMQGAFRKALKGHDDDPNNKSNKNLSKIVSAAVGGIGGIGVAGLKGGVGGMSNAAGGMMLASTNPILAAIGAATKLVTAGYDKYEGYYNMDKTAQGMGKTFDSHFKDMSTMEKFGVQGAGGYESRITQAGLGMAAGFMDEAVNMTVAARGALTLNDIETSTSSTQLTARFVSNARAQGKSTREILAAGTRAGFAPELLGVMVSGKGDEAALMKLIHREDLSGLQEQSHGIVVKGKTEAEEIYQLARSGGAAAPESVGNLVDKAKNAVKNFLPSTSDSKSGVPDSHQKVLSKIANLESSGNIDAVHRKGRPSTHKGLSNLTISEVLKLQKSGEFGAAGLYQMTNGTLGSLVKKYGDVNMSDKFDRNTQDKLASLLINEKAALRDHLSGKKVNPVAAQNALADIWMAVPKYGTGKSKFEGINTNRALTTDKEMQAMLARTGAVAATMASVRGMTPVNVKNEVNLSVSVVNNGDTTKVTATQDGRPIATNVVSSKAMGSTG